MTTSIASTGLQHGVNAVIGAMNGQLEAAHTATTAVVAAVFPPTNDGASARATLQNQASTAQFSAMLQLGFAEMAKLVAVTEATTVATEFTDAAGAATQAVIRA